MWLSRFDWCVNVAASVVDVVVDDDDDDDDDDADADADDDDDDDDAEDDDADDADDDDDDDDDDLFLPKKATWISSNSSCSPKMLSEQPTAVRVRSCSPQTSVLPATNCKWRHINKLPTPSGVQNLREFAGSCPTFESMLTLSQPSSSICPSTHLRKTLSGALKTFGIQASNILRTLVFESSMQAEPWGARCCFRQNALTCFKALDSNAKENGSTGLTPNTGRFTEPASRNSRCSPGTQLLLAITGDVRR